MTEIKDLIELPAFMIRVAEQNYSFLGICILTYLYSR